MAVIHKNPEEWHKMRVAGKLASQVLDYITEYVQVGVTTDYLNDLCEKFIRDHDAIPAPLGYRGYPKATCISVNHVVCHGIPSDKKLKNGDILNIDITVIKDEWYGDTSRMFAVGDKISVKAKRIIDIAFDSMWAGINTIKDGTTLGDVGHAIQSYAEQQGCSAVRDFCGHEIGNMFHGDLQVVNYGTPGQGAVLKEGMFLTVEPMVNLGKFDVRVLSDKWTAITKDRSLSAQFEHTLAVTQDGFEIFTKSLAGLDRPIWNK